ncbi:hypothetical protein RhiirA5_481799 [Rhizophagus irregularis]|uniref:Ion transport domain-containing protein n=1 Tax=Rhizophagus irregularis TaxID=588596 RepID=A0A2N0PJ11_9GLOM|nr:hypothetical protein RhiirA5_481799 [Rhizophagus irregularis]
MSLSVEPTENNRRRPSTDKDRRNRWSYFSNREDTIFKLSDNENDIILSKKERYQIAICQDGKFAVTFDTANLWIKVLENTDHRQFRLSKEKTTSAQHNSNNQNDDKEEITKTIARFKINENLEIDKFDKGDKSLIRETNSSANNSNDTDNMYRWSLDISNVQNYQDKYFIFVAVSRIDVNEDMKGKDTKSDYKKNIIKRRFPNSDVRIALPGSYSNKSNENKKGTAIYRLKLNKDNNNNFDFKEISPVTYCYSDSVSGICKFIQNLDDIDQNDYTFKRFIVLNFNGIYNFEYNFEYRSFDLKTRFDYPKSIENELKHWHKENLEEDCMNKLLTCLYNQYFLVEHYKNNVQMLEVYDLADMSLKTTPKRVERKDKRIRNFNYNTFSVSKLQICFTRGLNSIKLYFMENGLEVVSKKFDEIEKIYSLEFINSDEKLLIIGEKKDQAETITLENFSIVELSNRLARTSGNILQVDEEGRVTSVLKKIDKLKQNTSEEEKENFKKYTNKKDGNHTIHYDKEFDPIVIDKEPWVIDEYERNSYCLNQKKEGERIQTLQLIVGRSTVQIWHQIRDDSKSKDELSKLPNKGGPFLEYIWANGIPVNQERKATRLRIEEFKYKPNDGSSHILDDFYLKVYWYERASNVNNKGKTEQEIRELEDKEIEKMERNRKAGKEMEKDGGIMEMKEKVIQRKDIIEKVNAYEEMIMYIQHIVWRFAKCKPEEFKLLDVRHNVMKKLILGDCNYLIKLILFGDKSNKDNGNEKKEEFVIRHIPRSVSWPGKEFIRDDDLRFNNGSLVLEDNERPENDMELAIYRYKGRELKDTVVVAYLLEYYSSHATDYAGWMSTVSKALPLLFKYNYDDYARKLFRKECFANQDYFSTQDPYDIIPVEYQAKRNRNIKFRAFRIDKLQSDEYEWYNRITRKLFNPFKKMRKIIEDFDNYLEKSPLALRVVPLPEFTISRTPQKNRFVLLKNPNNPQINLKSDTLSGTAENLNNETLFNIKLVSDYDVQDKNDNPFSSFSTAIMAAYFWLNGDLIQRDHFDFWVIDLFTLIASIFIVTVLQNMLIAFMGGVYERAETKGRQALLRFRANQIADYEALEHFHFWPPETEPKYIYYVGRSKNFQEWYEKKKDDQGEIYKDFEEKSTINNQAFIDVDYNDVSIWKFDDNNSSNTKGKKREDSTDSSRLSKIVEENNNTPVNSLEKSQDVVLNEINEMKKMRDNINNLINQMYIKFNIPQ